MISSLACSAQQTASCTFLITDQVYTCRLIHFHTNTEFDFINLNGNHQEGMSDADVTRVDFAQGRMAVAFPEIVYDRFPSLDTVFITGNLMLQRFSIQRCERLKHFYFEGPANSVVRLPNGIFRNCSNMEEILIHRSAVSIVEENIFADTPRLKRLLMPRNQIMNIPIGLFRGLNQLEYLNIERNAIVDFDPQIFQGLKSLRHIQCGQMHNRIWPGSLFTNLPGLVEIDINWSGLQTILPGTFGALPSLEIIRIYGGELRRLSADVFTEPLPRLHTLNVQGNRIHAVQPAFFDNLPALRILIAANNLCVNQDFPDIGDMQPVFDAFENCFNNY